MPTYVQRLLNKNEIKGDKKISLTLLYCSKCKLCQLKNNFVGRNYYDNYSWTPVSYSKQMQDYQRWLAKDFVNYFNLKEKSAFEIGCGDGMFAAFLNKYGLKTVGIEPSKFLYNLAKRKIRVLNEYLSKNTSLRHHYYDAFVARQVFEHLNNPNQVLKDVKLYLKPGGVGLIEVPSFLTIIKNNRYYDISREHVAYYTKYTLQYLLTKNNFQVIRIFHSADDEYLTLILKITIVIAMN
jgi:2-polyprenyl-3-methyl-5-hydroxy-6-metoxy-1,4-benzoquinol methylase